MICAAALVPQAPLLLTGLTGLADPVAPLRRHLSQVVAELVTRVPDEVVLLASGEVSAELEVSTDLGLHRWGVGAGTAARPPDRPGARPGDRPGALERPALPFVVGSQLLDAAGWTGPRRWQQVGWCDAGGAAFAVGRSLAAGSERVALLVLGDGSARRTAKAPGFLDGRAQDHDVDLVDALRTDPRRLADIDAGLSVELMVSGLPAWQALAGALGACPEASADRPVVDLRWTGDPFGVLYLVGWAEAGGTVRPAPAPSSPAPGRR